MHGYWPTATIKMLSLLHPTWCQGNTLWRYFTNVLWILPITMSECKNSGMQNFQNHYGTSCICMFMYNLLLRINLPTSSTLLCMFLIWIYIALGISISIHCGISTPSGVMHCYTKVLSLYPSLWHHGITLRPLFLQWRDVTHAWLCCAGTERKHIAS